MYKDRIPMLDIDGLMTGLARSRKLFHSEADFQHALAWQIHEAMPESRIRLEVDAFSVQTRRRFLDIWMPVEGIAIELKYVTRTLELEEDGELFALRTHSAQDLRRYDFLLDIQRLELIALQRRSLQGWIRGAANQRLGVLEGPRNEGYGGRRLPYPRGKGHFGRRWLGRNTPAQEQ